MTVLKSGTVVLLPVAFFLGGCLLEQGPSQGPKQYPISAGRYYLASDLIGTTRANALQYEDFGDSGVYAHTLLKQPGCRIQLKTGSWYVRESGSDDGISLTRHNKKLAGANDTSTAPCLDANPQMYDVGTLLQGQIRGITDTSFETCPRSYEVCNQLCPTASPNPDDACYNHASGPNDTVLLWARYVK